MIEPSTEADAASEPERVRRRDAFPVVAGVVEVTLGFLGIAASLALKASVGARGPLWLDEAWTGAIAAARPFSAFARQAWLDVNPPLYFLLMHGWVQVAGLSAQALRTPSLLFAVATPFVAALVRTPGLSGPERLTWATVLALWGQTIFYAQEARGYSLLILLATFQAIAFVRLLRAPARGTAAAWAACACLVSM